MGGWGGGNNVVLVCVLVGHESLADANVRDDTLGDLLLV